MGRRACALFLLILCVSFVGAIAQRTLVVPVDYSTVEDAIEAALPGDVIEVFGGIYGETLVITKSLTILGIPKEAGCGCGERQVLIRPRDRDQPIIRIETDETAEVVIEELTISGADCGSAIKVSGSGNLDLNSCKILENDVGLDATGDCTISVRDCEFKANDRYGLWFSGNTSFAMEECFFVREAGLSDEGAIMLVGDDASGAVQNCSILGVVELDSADVQDREGLPCAIGIQVEDRASLSVLGCEIQYPRGIGIQVNDRASLSVLGCEIGYLCQGIALEGGTEVLVTENTFAACDQGAVAALSVTGEMRLSIIENTVGSFGTPPVGRSPLAVLGGSFDSPIEVSDNVIGDIGACAPFDLHLEPCQEVFNSELKFEGTITGHGNILSASYQGPAQCPAWESPFWPEDFLKE